MDGSEHFIWTQHSRVKMRQYRLTESRIKRIIRHPARTEEGILEGAIACMTQAGGKKYSEIWTMYVLVRAKVKGPSDAETLTGRQKSKVKVITAWRYPGKSPERDPVPKEVLREIKNLL